MIRYATALLICTWVLAAPAGAALKALEQAIESTTLALHLPAGGGRLTVDRCPDCEPLLLTITAETASFVDGERVDYADLHRAASSSIAAIYVFYEPDSRRVTRLLLRR